MRLYESAYTYIPFVYLFMSSTLFGIAFHHAGSMRDFRPYTLFIFLLLNTSLQFYFKTERLIKNEIHRHVWKTVTLAFYGILFNSAHEIIFEKFNLENYHLNIGVCLIYLMSVFVSGYYFQRNSYVVYCHIIALFFPIYRIWEINLHIYVVYVSLSIFIMFSKCSDESLMNPDLYMGPVIKFFIYLRINDSMIFFGIIQLYLEYYQLVIPELKALDEIESIINEQSMKIDRQIFDNGI
jgi:hypothetical protein